jgi:hypothetical protein
MGMRERCGRVDRKRNVVTAMNSEQRKAILDQARATLKRTAKIEVEQRDHFDDALTRWSAGMPKQQPTRVSPGFTDAEVARMIAAAVAEQVEQKIAANDRIWEDTLGKVVSDLRKQWRSEFEQQLGSLRADITVEKAHRRQGEFFYLDETGRKRDAELHGPILRAVDHPIDETIMAPIRARNRTRWLDQKARRRG